MNIVPPVYSKWTKHYLLLAEKARTRNLEGYVEKHHVVPRCMGGSDDADNLVELTPEEHFTAHLLLMRMYPEHAGLAAATMLLCADSPTAPQKTRLTAG